MVLRSEQPIVPKEFEVVISLEEEFNRLLQRFLDEKRKEVLSVLDEFNRGRLEVKAFTGDNIIGEMLVIFNPQNIEAAVKSIIKKIVDFGVESVEKDLDVNITRNKMFSETVARRSFTMVKGLTEDLAVKLRDELMVGWSMGEGIPQLRERILKTWGDENLTTARANMIARTETNNAFNGARMQGAKDSGVPVVKRWNAFFDGRTGVDSKGLNGQTRPLDQDFYDDVNHLFIPHPPNRPNCRCRMDVIPI